MEDQLAMLLKAKIDMASSIKDINSQIKFLQSELKSIDIPINIKGIDSQFKDVFSKIVSASKSSSSEVNSQIEKINGTLDQTQKHAKSLEDTLSLFKKNMNFKMDGFNNFDNIDTSKLNSLRESINSLNPSTENVKFKMKDLAIEFNKFKKETQDTKSLDNLRSKLDEFKKMKGVKLELLEKNGGDIDKIKQLRGELNKLSVDTPQLANKMKSLSNDIQIVGTETQKSGKSFKDFVGYALGMTSVYEAFQMVKRGADEMVSSINEMNKSLTNIRIVTDMSKQEVNNLGATYNNLGKELGATTNQLLSGAEEWFRQGKTVQETQELITSSLIGSKLAGIETAQMTQLLTSSLNGYKLSSDKAISVVDKMVAVDNAAATSVEELATALSRCASTAQSVNVDMDTLIGYVGTVSSVTRKSAESIGESFKSMFARFTNLKLGKTLEDVEVASDVRMVLNSINIELMKSKTEFKDFSQVINELTGKWGTLTDVERSAVAQAMAGQRQRENFLVLMDNMSKATELTTTSLESQGLAVDRYGIYLEGTQAKIDQFKATMESIFMKTLNSDTVNLVIGLGTGILRLIDNCGGLIPILTTIIALVGVLKAQAITTAISGVIKNLSLLPAMLKGLALSMNGVSTATTMAGASMATLATGGLGLLVVAISGAVMAWNAYENAQRQAIETFKQENVEITNKLSKTDELIAKYEELSKKNKDNKEVREQLLEVQKGLVEEFGSEISGIDLVNRSYDENIGILDKVIERKKILKGINDEKIQLGAEKDIDDIKKDIIFAVRPDEESLKTLGNVIEKLSSETKKSLNVFTDSNGNMVMKLKADVETETAIKAMEDFRNVASLNGLDLSMYEQFIRYYDEFATKADVATTIQEKKIQEDAKETVENIKKANSIKDVTNATKEQYANMKKDITSSFMTGLSMSSESAKKLTSALEELNSQFPQFANETSNGENSIQELQDGLKELDDKTESTINSMKDLNSAIDTLSQGNQLSADTILDLTKKYPELTDSVTELNGVYSISKDALVSLKNKQIDEANTAIAAQQTKTFQVLNDTARRIQANDKEILSIQNLKDAYAVLAKLMATAQTESETFINKSKGYVYGSGGVSQETRDKLGQMAVAIGSAEKQLKEIEARKQRINIATSGGGLKTSGGGSRGGSSKSSSEKYAKYTTQGIDDAIKEIKEKGNLISTEIEFLDKKIANATTKGDETLIQTLSDKRTVLQSKLPEVYHQSAEELRKLQSNLINQLQKSNLPELKNMDLAKLTESELNKVIRIYEQKAEQAGNKGNNKLKASYEVQKGLLQEVGNGIVEINKDITSLQQSWWDKTNESLESTIENIKRVKDAKDRLIDSDDKNIEVGLILTNDTSDEYYNLMQRKQDNLLKHQQNIEEALSKLRKKGTLEESQEIRELKDSWYDYEKQRIEMAKQRGEAIRENRLKELNRELSDTKDGTSSITSLLSLVKEMIKQETSEKSEELKKQTDDRKNALNDQYNAEKDALNKRLALLREEADKRKKALQEESSERSYQQELSEKQKKYTDTYNAIQGLQGDNRLSTVKKRKELEAQLANYKKELDDLQYKHSVETQEKAIDDKLEMQEKELENQLDNLENNHDKELKALDDLYNKQIKKLEDRIKTEGKLQEEAMKLIDNKNSDLYKRLEKYALEYTSMTRTEVTNIWEKGYDAIDKYDGRQKGVLNTLESLISKTNEYAESIKKIEDAKSNDSTNWKDYVDEKDYSSNSKDDSSGGQDDGEIRDIVAKMKQNSALYPLMNTKEKKKILEQRNEDLAKGIDGAWKESDGVWYIKKNGKKKRLYDVYHNGIENGEIGSKTFTLKQNEQMAKLATKEIVLNPTQTRNVVDNFNNLSGGSTTVGDVNVTLQIAADRIDRSSLPFIRDMITEEVPRAIQTEIVKMGIR